MTTPERRAPGPDVLYHLEEVVARLERLGDRLEAFVQVAPGPGSGAAPTEEDHDATP